MKRLLRTLNEGRADHRDAVKDRLRGLMSVAHEVDEISPQLLRSKLNGGRSALAGARRVQTEV